MSTDYRPMVNNPSPLEVVNSATFGPAVRRAFHDMGRVDVTPYAIPWSGIDVPLVTDLPINPNDRAEVNLLVGDGVTRMLYRKATDRWQQIGAPPMVSALPTAPSAALDGLSVAYNVSGALGGVWLFRYRADGDPTYPWDFAGGTDLYDDVDTEETTAAASYGNLATTGPDVTCPFAGIYMVSFGAATYNIGGGIGYVSHTLGSTGGADQNAILYSGATTSVNHARTGRETIASDGDTIVMVYKTTAGTLHAASRWLRVTPIKVAG